MTGPSIGRRRCTDREEVGECLVGCCFLCVTALYFVSLVDISFPHFLEVC